jgi:hypothetical protein
MSSPERALTLLLRLAAAMLLLAVVPVVMPFRWMGGIHRFIGLGGLPDALIVHYLTRSASALYAFHGAIILFISCDVRRYRTFILFLGWLSTAFGAVMLVLDIAIGMPLPWIIGEGPFVIALGIAIVWLAARVRREGTP